MKLDILYIASLLYLLITTPSGNPAAEVLSGIEALEVAEAVAPDRLPIGSRPPSFEPGAVPLLRRDRKDGHGGGGTVSPPGAVLDTFLLAICTA